MSSGPGPKGTVANTPNTGALGCGIARPGEAGFEVAILQGIDHVGGRRHAPRLDDLDGQCPIRHVFDSACEDTDALPGARKRRIEGRLHLNDTGYIRQSFQEVELCPGPRRNPSPQPVLRRGLQFLRSYGARPTIRRPAPPAPPTAFAALFTHRVSFARAGAGNKEKTSPTKSPIRDRSGCAGRRWCLRRSGRREHRARSSPPGSPKRTRNRRGSE
jgi:hypothetical protein